MIRDDMRLKGFDVDKKFSRWLGKLVDSEVVFVEGNFIRVNIEV